MFLVRYRDPASGLPPLPPHWPELAAQRIEYKWAVYEHEREQATWLDDDYVPHLSMLTGTEIFAEALGCEVARPGDTNPFALPLIHDARGVDAVRVPEMSTSSLAYHFDMADELRLRAGKEALFRIPDVQSPMDIAALVWEKSSFFVAMMENHEPLRVLAGKVQELLTAFFDEWFGRYGGDYIAHFPDYFMRGGLTLSEDEVGGVSAELFEELFLPELVGLSDHFGGLGMHCCADARHQWPGFRKVPGLRLLNLNRPPTREDEYVIDAFEHFRDHCVQWHTGWNPQGSPEDWPEQIPPGCRFVQEIPAESRDEAKRLCEGLQQVREGWHP